MNIYVLQLFPSLHQVRLPGAPPQLHLLFGASRSSPGLLSLPGVATGKTFFFFFFGILFKAIHAMNNIHYSGLVCDRALFVFL